MSREPYTTGEAAEAVGITRVTLQAWIAKGKLKAPPTQLLNGRAVRLWAKADVVALQRVKDKIYRREMGRPKKTTVVHVKAARYDIYIGRANPRNVLAKSIWGNPFKGRGAIEKYRKWLMEPAQAWLRKRLPELRGRTLGCWCKPAYPCHGDILAELADQVKERPKVKLR